MAHRKEVFQSKVLQRLYPAAPKSEKEPIPPNDVESLAKAAHVKRKVSLEHSAAGAGGQRQRAAGANRRMYTVLPPPADYKKQSEGSVMLPQLESINSAENPAEEHVHESNEELDQNKEQEKQKRKRKRRKGKAIPHQDSGQDGSSSTGQSQRQAALDEGGGRISRNKKRKLKKKRHKEKLLSMGVMPRAAALEFTYQKDEEEEEEEEEEDNKKNAAEVSAFLGTTLDIYKSHYSLCEDKPSLPSGTVEDLLSHICSGSKPNSVLKQLCSLTAFVQQKDTNSLEKALKELHNNSCMSAEETAAVVSLFQYWITDILPVQADKKTGLSATHP